VEVLSGGGVNTAYHGHLAHAVIAALQWNYERVFNDADARRSDGSMYQLTKVFAGNAKVEPRLDSRQPQRE
jgi:hypothetical protein